MKTMKQHPVKLVAACVLGFCLFQNVSAQNSWILNGNPQKPANAPVGGTGSSETPLQIQINALPTVPASMLPKSGTFWSLQSSLMGHSVPLPCNPFRDTFTNLNVEVHAFADGSFLLNDIGVDYSALHGGENSSPPPTPQGGSPSPPQLLHARLTLSLTNPVNISSGQLRVDTENWGGGWIWGIASRTNLDLYDPRQTSWQLLDPNYYAYDLDGSSYFFDMPPFDKPMEFYKSFDIQDYFQGYWTPIKYLGSNIAPNGTVTTNDVVMKFNLAGDIYKFFTNTARAVQAIVVRPSGETVGCFAEIATNGIATVVAPVGNFGTGANYVWVSFVNEGPQLTNSGPSQPIDMSYLLSLDVPGQETYLQSINFDVSATGELTNNYPHSFTGYLVFNAAPLIEDTVAAPYVAPYVVDESNPIFHRSYKYREIGRAHV